MRRFRDEQHRTRRVADRVLISDGAEHDRNVRDREATITGFDVDRFEDLDILAGLRRGGFDQVREPARGTLMDRTGCWGHREHSRSEQLVARVVSGIGKLLDIGRSPRTDMPVERDTHGSLLSFEYRKDSFATSCSISVACLPTASKRFAVGGGTYPVCVAATLEELEARVAALEAGQADYRAVLASMNALAANQREHAEGLVALRNETRRGHEDLSARIRSLEDNHAEIKDLLIRALDR